MTADDRPPRPARPVFRSESIPLELREIAQWVLWRYAWSDKKKKWDKPPLRTDGYKGSSTAPDCRYGFEMALATARQKDGDFDGIGFVLTRDDPFTAIDLDHCVDRATRIVAAWAQEIVDEIDSYTEISPSGEGIRIFVRAKLPPGGRRKGSVEMYDDGRYVTLTGDAVEQKPVADRQTAIEAVHARVFLPESQAPERAASVPTTLDDRGLIERAQNARNGPKFTSLWRGDTSGARGDHSIADLQLCARLAFWTGRDAARMDRLFRDSGLMRPKWDERHGERTYGAMTIAKAIERCRETYEPVRAATDQRSAGATKLRAEQPSPATISFVRADAIEPVAIPWFERDRVPAGELSILEGDGGTGKSTVALDYLARKTRGWTLPGGTPTSVGNVLVVADEDAKTTIVARLQAAGADLSRVLILMHLGPAEYPRNFILPDDCPELSRFIAAEAVEVVYLDALFNHFAHGLLPKNPQDARIALSPLATMAHNTGATIIGTRHWGKGARDATERGLGANEIKNVARSVLVVARHPDIEGLYAVAVVKKNYGRDVPALTYRIVSQQVRDREGKPMHDAHGEPFTVGRIEWGDTAPLSADDLAMAGAQHSEEAAGREACTHFLFDYLGEGEAPSENVYQEAGKRKFSRSTTLRAAKSIGIIFDQRGFPRKTTWSLPHAVTSQSRQEGEADATAMAEPVASVTSQSRQSVNGDATGDFDVTELENTRESAVTSPPPPTRVRARENVVGRNTSSTSDTSYTDGQADGQRNPAPESGAPATATNAWSRL